MPPTVTPSAITASEVVVVPVVVAVRTTPAETPPATPRPSTNNKARPARFTGASLAREDAGIVRNHAVDAELVERLHLIPRGESPGQHRRADGVTALDDPAVAHGLHQGSLCPARLQVKLNPARARGQEGEPFVERRELGRELGVRMGEDERAVQLEHVDLYEVAAELHGECQRRDRVL